MPRIACEAIPGDPTAGELLSSILDAAGAGSSTFDLCQCCLDDLGGDGAEWPSPTDEPSLRPYHGEDGLAAEGRLVICSGLEHPDYADDEYTCTLCAEPLDEVLDA